jgi:valyl-tRNA synthetase
MTDEQIDEQQSDTMLAEDAQREAELDMEYDDVAAAEVHEEETIAEVESALKDDKPLPLDSEGEVDEEALWNEDPGRWAAWNDERKQDGGSDSFSALFHAKNALEEEIAKMEAEIAHLTKFLKGVEAKLSNERFVQNAPEAVVAMERKKQSDATTKIENLRNSIANLKK